ncbi:MAG: DUF1007 family protein, partial [Pseudomonadota bacterium]
LRLINCITFCFGMLVMPASAHPHVWVDASARVMFDDVGAISAIRHSWRFDEAFSAYLMLGLDVDGDGIYSRQETAELAELNVTSLQEYFYFTSIAGAQETDRLGDLYSLEFDAPRDYFLDFDGTHTTLHFTLPVQGGVRPGEHDFVVLDIFDPEYFVAFSLVETAPIELASAPDGCSVTLDEPPELDTTYANLLSLIPADGFVPEELLAVTNELANRARIRCA